MDETLLRYLLLGIAVLVTAMSLLGVLVPARLVNTVGDFWGKSWSLPFAAGIRLVMGVSLVLLADSSRFPLAFEILGWIAIVAALLLPIVGKQRVSRLLEWIVGWPSLLMRLTCLLGVVFGLFIGYGVL